MEVSGQLYAPSDLHTGKAALLHEVTLLLSYLKIETIILPLVLYGCET
jgi:hypothetical protein